MQEAIDAQKRGALAAAESSYRAALAMNPRSFDALHMLGVVKLQAGDAEEAARLLVVALPLMEDPYPPLFQNLGLSLAAVASGRGLERKPADSEREGDAYLRFFRRNNLPVLPAFLPLVSIIAPCCNNERHVTDAIASVSRQTYPNIELIVIDDGSMDGSVAAISRALADCRFSNRFIVRENRGAHATLNEGIELASGQYIGILSADGLHAPERTEFMVRMLEGTESRWGLSNVAYIDDRDRVIPYGEQSWVNIMMKHHDALYRCCAVSENFPTHNHAVSAGNLFFERSLWQEIGGFEDLQHNHDWAFCLAAILVAEPAYLDEPAYCHRVCESDTVRKHKEQARQEADALLDRWCRVAASMPRIDNATLAQARKGQRTADFSNMANGYGHLVNRTRLLVYAAELGFGNAAAEGT